MPIPPLALTVLRAGKPSGAFAHILTPAMYIPAVCSMYIRSELPTAAIELHGLGLLGSRMGGSTTSVMVSLRFPCNFLRRFSESFRLHWQGHLGHSVVLHLVCLHCSVKCTAALCWSLAK